MQNQEQKTTKKITMNLDPLEVWAVNRWRNKYRFGRIEFIIHKGLPKGIEKGILKDYPTVNEIKTL